MFAKLSQYKELEKCGHAYSLGRITWEFCQQKYEYEHSEHFGLLDHGLIGLNVWFAINIFSLVPFFILHQCPYIYTHSYLEGKSYDINLFL